MSQKSIKVLSFCKKEFYIIFFIINWNVQDSRVDALFLSVNILEHNNTEHDTNVVAELST